MNDSSSDVRHLLRLGLLLLGLLLAGGAQAQKALSFLANVHPDSDQTAFSVQLNDQSITTADLNDLLRPGGGSALRVTSIHILLIDHATIPAETDYALLFLGALGPRASIRGFGAGTISTSGGTTTQINFDPGLYVTLDSDEQLTLRSQLQSNKLARVEVHGFLEAH